MIERNKVYRADCVAFLERVPPGVFDLAFADPPYNLKKLYATYDDARAEREYLAWCERWLDGMARTLKPGGSLFVLNLPKWAMHHAAFLNERLQFRHWIVWDALSEPRGKLLPAHYALLYYTKPGATPIFHPMSVIAPKYCLRPQCLKHRTGDPVELTDVWTDVHRIKHRRDRDAHPCQLPDKLLERIISLTTRPGDLVFDPFCGAGTTALIAAKLGRDFVTVDVDPHYVRITNEKLATGRPRARVPRPRRRASKREVEIYLQQLTHRLGRVPAEEEITREMLAKIDLLYPYRSAALKRAKIGLVTAPSSSASK